MKRYISMLWRQSDNRHITFIRISNYKGETPGVDIAFSENLTINTGCVYYDTRMKTRTISWRKLRWVKLKRMFIFKVCQHIAQFFYG